MPERMTERYDVASIRLTREGEHDLLKVVDAIAPGGSVFHILVHSPGQMEDLLAILVDGATVIEFELPRRHGAALRDVRISTFTAYRQKIGQGKHRLLLDHAAADACRLLV